MDAKEKGICFYSLPKDPIKRGLWLSTGRTTILGPAHTSAASISLAVSGESVVHA